MSSLQLVDHKVTHSSSWWLLRRSTWDCVCQPATEMKTLQISSAFLGARSTLLSHCELLFSQPNQRMTELVPPYGASDERNLQPVLEVVVVPLLCLCLKKEGCPFAMQTEKACKTFRGHPLGNDLGQRRLMPGEVLRSVFGSDLAFGGSSDVEPRLSGVSDPTMEFKALKPLWAQALFLAVWSAFGAEPQEPRRLPLI